MNRDGRRRPHSVKLITGGWDDATNAIADWDLALLPVSRRSESSRHPLAVKSRITAHTETILNQMSHRGKQLESFTLTHCRGNSALHDGLESVGFEVVARI